MKIFKNIIKEILSIFILPYIYFYLYAMSYKNYLISLFKTDIVNSYQPHQNGQSILLIALFQKTYLRKDIIRLLEASKRAGLYVIAVNTRSLSEAFLDEHQHLIDVYISQYNYGRDFGSYQKGFKYIFKNGLQQHAARILMLNDSVYYDADRTPQFLDEMINSPQEVLGATENHEISYHLGSFAISFAKRITNNAKFIQYWKNYKLSDIRPLVIKRGEMGLSKMLAQLVSNEDEIKAIYNTIAVRNFLMQPNQNFKTLYKLCRQSDLVGWPRVSLLKIFVEFLTSKRLQLTSGKSMASDSFNTNKNEILLERTVSIRNEHFIFSFEDVDNFFNQLTSQPNQYKDEYHKFMISKLIENSRFGSQIHQNNAAFVFMGLPIIKLDGVYRGMFNEIDVTNFEKLLKPDYFNELIKLLYKKPFGGDVLLGWKKVAFLRGLI